MRPPLMSTLRTADARELFHRIASAAGFGSPAFDVGDGHDIEAAALFPSDRMVMLGDGWDDDGNHSQPVVEASIARGPYLVIEDIDRLYAVAEAAGASILTDSSDTGDTSGEDPAVGRQSNSWSFGTCDPWRIGA